MGKKKKLSLLLVLLGITLLFSDRIFSYKINKNTNEALEDFNKLNIEEIRDNKDLDEEYDFELIDYIKPSKTYLTTTEGDKSSIVGQLVIPSIEANMVIFDGISNSKLLSGVCTMKENQTMGEGNFALAGHYGFEDKLLYNLDKVEINDEIRITNKEKIYIYKVTDIEIVKPDRLDMIEDYEDGMISIMNCYYEDGKNTGNRLFVIGKLHEVMEYDDSFIEN